MINNERSYASLSSGLLARKGAAKPAMRPQGFTGFEDLGWNDMGHAAAGPEGFDGEGPEHVPSSIAALTPAPRHAKPEEPEVVAQQRAIAEREHNVQSTPSFAFLRAGRVRNQSGNISFERFQQLVGEVRRA